MKIFFGAAVFIRFDQAVKRRIIPNLKISGSNGGTTSGTSGIVLDEPTHQLRGYSSTTYYTRPENQSPPCPASVSATMTGPGVSVSANSNNCEPNPSVELVSTSYLSNSEYCVRGSHSADGKASVTSIACLMTPDIPRITTVEYEQILTDDGPIDVNPNIGGGRRIFPDKKIPAETVDRRKIRVKAQNYQATAGVRIYFRNFDVDDPSANTAPIDNETMLNAGNDNNGNVDGTTATRAGVLSAPPAGQPNPYNCQPFSNPSASGISCETDAAGLTKVDFTVTMQPGDNFAVVASPDEAYISSLIPAADGINLKDANSIQTPVTTTATNSCLTSSIKACRADMLTVWRRLHIEVDSMGNVGTDNNVTGTISAVRQISNPGCNLPPPFPPPPLPVPRCYPTITVYDLATTDGMPLEVQRFANGRIVIGLRQFRVVQNIATTIELPGDPSLSRKVRPGSQFTLYDDDDYNEDDNLDNGDNADPIVPLPESFKYLSAEDGLYPDGKPKNMYASAYIIPEYNWVQNVATYNQTNLQFDLNVEPGNNNSNFVTIVNQNRDSRNDERDDFWLAYVLIGYQGPLLSDFDGLNPAGTANEAALQGFAASQTLPTELGTCDCYNSPNCPIGAKSCTLLNGTIVFPKGGAGAIVFQEVNQDLTRYFSRLPPPYTTITTEEIKITIPHEIGHQFGLLGDQTRTLFGFMDYSNYLNNVINSLILHPEHVNIMRRRIKSPGI